MREKGEGAQRIVDRVGLRPRPEHQHDRIGDAYDREQNAPETDPSGACSSPNRLRGDRAPDRVQGQQQAEIADSNRPPTRTPIVRPIAAPSLTSVPKRGRGSVGTIGSGNRCSRRADCERNVLRIVEHLPVIIRASAIRKQRGDKAGARTAEARGPASRIRPGRGRRPARSADAASRTCRTGEMRLSAAATMSNTAP